MLKIVKYEWLRRWKFFLAGLAVFVVTNVDLASRMVTNGNPTIFSAILIAVLFTMTGVLVFDHIGRLYKPLMTEEGTFVFSTPISGYRLLGGKLLAVVLEYIGVAVFVALVTSIDYFVLTRYLPEMRFSADIPLDYLLARGLQLNALLLLGYVSFILTAYLSMALAKSFLSSVKYGPLLAFVIFIVIVQVGPWLGVNLGLAGVNHISINPNDAGFFEYWLAGIAIALGTASALFGITGYLLDKKVNV